uniref:Uncharacterized protein n=1 Tax=Anopheles albimanus TaxID=7167 RepID=A0A182FC36_ANOAL
ILKKQSHNEYDDPTAATSSNAYKGSKKIGFHRKMSIKEFTIGENTETIWGNSYEVSADGTSPRIACDHSHTLNDIPSNHPETLLLQEENKENVTLVPANRTEPALDDNSASASNSWDLSITIAEEEKRRMRSDSMLNCSQNLNMTERLMMEPTHLSTSSAVKRRSSSEVLAMDVSPLKPTVTVSATSRSPRKMMYYNPKQGVTVQINDVPIEQAQPAAREESNNRSYKRSMPCDRSETWNSHPQAMFQLSALRRSSEGLTDMSSDFDNTIAITNTVDKLLKAGANLTLTVPTNMELDESATVTDVKLPTNALARARPSFLPSQNRQHDVAEDEEEHVESIEVPATTANASNPPTACQLNETSVAPSTSFGGNLSLSFDDVQQPVMNKSASVSRGTKSDFKISSMSLGLSSPNSPEPVNAGQTKILRPTLPLTLFQTVSKAEPPQRTLVGDGPSERSAITRQTLHTPTEMDETQAYEASGAKPKQSILTPTWMETVTKEPSSRSYRATIYETNDMIDGDEGQPSSTSADRATVVQRNTMELSSHSHRTPVDSSVLPSRRTVHAQQPMDESIMGQSASESRDLRRMTKNDRMTMQETSPGVAKGRNTLYPNESMVQDLETETESKAMYSQCTAVVSRNSRQTILNNDSMVLDNPQPRVSPISCGIYGDKLDTVGVHVESETHAMDVQCAMYTTKHALDEPCAANANNRSRPTTMVMEECMRLSEVYAPQCAVMQRNDHSAMAMDEEERYGGAMERDKDVSQQSHNKYKSRISVYQSIAMDQTDIVEEGNGTNTAHRIDHSSKKQIHHSRPTTHQIEAMEVTSARKDQFVLADQMPIVTQSMQVSEGVRNAGAKQFPPNSPVLSPVPGSPMDMSHTAAVDPNPMARKPEERSTPNARSNSVEMISHSIKPSQRSRHSIYQSQDMEQTLPSTSAIESPKERPTLQPARSSLRKSILQKIVRQTPVEDMEGISLLTDDDDLRTVSANEPLLVKPNRATMHFVDDAAQIVEESMVATTDGQLMEAAPMDSKDDRAINRQTTYEAQAMERETNIMSSAFRGSSKMVETGEPSYREPIVQMNSKEDRSKQRQTMYEAVEMEEETSSYQPLLEKDPIVEIPNYDHPTDRQTIYTMQAMRENADIVSCDYRSSTKMFASEERTEPIVVMNSKEDRSKQRQTMYEAVAMEEETSSYRPMAMVDKDPTVEIPKHDRPVDHQTIYDMQEMRNKEDIVSSGYRVSTKLLTSEERTAYNEPIVPMNSKEDHSKRHRQTIYDAHAMEEETSFMPVVHHVTVHSRLENAATESAKRSPSLTLQQQRKSSVCMEETVALLPVRRIERHGTPEGILSESPKLPPHTKRDTIHAIDDTMEITLGAAENNGPDQQHRTLRMDAAEKRQHLANRQTKIHLAPMDTTILHDDHSPAAADIGDAGVCRKPLTQDIPDRVMDQQQQQQQPQLDHENPVSVKRENSRRPRQTILLAQDMEIEDTAVHVMEGRVKEEESFAFPKLVRETTEDCVMRCAPLAKMIRGREGFSDAIGDPYAMPSRSTAIGMDKSSIGYPHIFDGIAREDDRQLHQLHPALDRTLSTNIYQESIDISISRSILPTEPPQIDNISGHYMSMRDVTAPLATVKQLTATEENSVSVSSVIRHGSTTMEPEPMQSVMVAPAAVADTASDDEFHDAEDEPANDPLSLTKSRHLLQSMKFIDVEQLERTGVLATSKRVHANVRSSSSTVEGAARDPLHVTLGQQQQQEENPQPLTPQGPLMKKKRFSNSPASLTANTMPVMQPLEESPGEGNEAMAAPEQYDPPEGSRAFPLIANGRRSVINDPSVFVIDDDDDLLDDESQLPSFTDEQLNTRQEDQQENATHDESSSVKRFFKPLNDLSYYRDFANLTLNEWNEEDHEQPEQKVQEEQPSGPAENIVADCISISDDSVTGPMGNLTIAQRQPRRSESGVLDSTIADEFMEELMAKLPRRTKHPCCGSDNDCLCRLRRQLERRRKADEREWQLFDKQFASRVPADASSHVSASAFEHRFEELCWQLGDLEQDLSTILETAMVKGKEREEGSVEGNTDEREEFRSWRLSGGSTFPEIPNVVFLYENLRSCLQEQPRVDDSPPTGAHLPRVPHITLLVANKLATEHEGSGWCLDLSEEALFDHLMFRHRTISSFHVSVQLQSVQSEPSGSARQTARPGVPREEDRYIERIQVETTDAFEKVRLSPMRYLLHMEFMRLTMETTEQTLRSKYRTVGSLMGLWRHFSELFECASRNVLRLLTIVENGDAMLSYDSVTEQFCVKKWFQRHQDTTTGGRLTSNVLQVYFGTINGIAPSGKLPRIL